MDSMKELKFKCPECGNSGENAIEVIVGSYRIIKIKENGVAVYRDKPSLSDGMFNEPIYNMYYPHDQNFYYQCWKCGFVLKNGVIKVRGGKELVKWLKENCNQE